MVMAAPSGSSTSHVPGVLPPERELFASLVAAGYSTRQAAERCGLDKDYGWDLAQRPEIKARIVAMAEEPNEAAKRSIRAELQILRQRAAQFGDDVNVRAEIACRLQVLMAAAKVEGMIVDRKQVDKRSMSARVSREDMQLLLMSELDRLAPGASAQLEKLDRPAKPEDLKAIAAGGVIEANASTVSPNNSRKRTLVPRGPRTQQGT